MSAAYEPGTVARIVLKNGVVHPVAIRLPIHEGGWATATVKYIHSAHVADVRPLVVLDLPNGALAGWPVLIDACRKARDTTGYEMTFSGLIEQIEAQTKPPKPVEPTGLGAVVETDTGHRWTRTRSHDHGLNWREEWGGRWIDYADLDVVRVLSEGVTA